MSGVRRPACRTKAFLLESPPVATFLLHDAGVGALPLEHAALNGSNESHDAPRCHGLCRVSHPIRLSYLRLRGSRCLHFAASTCGSAGCECLCLCADRCVCVCVCLRLGVLWDVSRRRQEGGVAVTCLVAGRRYAADEGPAAGVASVGLGALAVLHGLVGPGLRPRLCRVLLHWCSPGSASWCPADGPCVPAWSLRGGPAQCQGCSGCSHPCPSAPGLFGTSAMQVGQERAARADRVRISSTTALPQLTDGSGCCLRRRPWQSAHGLAGERIRRGKSREREGACLIWTCNRA